eukprot:COSAG06_NODE_33251_length_493_cov_0.525381_1_plen_85_part_10
MRNADSSPFEARYVKNVRYESSLISWITALMQACSQLTQALYKAACHPHEVGGRCASCPAGHVLSEFSWCEARAAAAGARPLAAT